MAELGMIERPQEETSPFFRELHSQIERIFVLADAPDLMSFGPSVADKDTALNEEWIDSEEDFVPMLRALTLKDAQLEIYGTQYTSAKFFFRQEGNKAAAKDWLGEVRLEGGDDQLGYIFKTNGIIEIEKLEHSRVWASSCDTGEEEENNLKDALDAVEGHLLTQRLGETALA